MSEKKGFWSLFGGKGEEGASEKGTATQVKEVLATDQPQERGARTNDNPVTQEVCDFAVASLQGLLDASQLSGQVKLKQFTETFFALDILEAGEDNGRLIGKKGTTVLAFQTLVRQFVYRKFQVRCKLSIDVDGYKSRQNVQIRAEVMEVANRVIRDGGEVALAPMSAIERRSVHVMFEHHDVLCTESRGEGDVRYVVIKQRSA